MDVRGRSASALKRLDCPAHHTPSQRRNRVNSRRDVDHARCRVARGRGRLESQWSWPRRRSGCSRRAWAASRSWPCSRARRTRRSSNRWPARDRGRWTTRTWSIHRGWSSPRTLHRWRRRRVSFDPLRSRSKAPHGPATSISDPTCDSDYSAPKCSACDPGSSCQGPIGARYCRMHCASDSDCLCAPGDTFKCPVAGGPTPEIPNGPLPFGFCYNCRTATQTCDDFSPCCDGSSCSGSLVPGGPGRCCVQSGNQCNGPGDCQWRPALLHAR